MGREGEKIDDISGHKSGGINGRQREGLLDEMARKVMGIVHCKKSWKMEECLLFILKSRAKT